MASAGAESTPTDPPAGALRRAEGWSWKEIKDKSYNPHFTLTPEVVAILHSIYDDLCAEAAQSAQRAQSTNAKARPRPHVQRRTSRAPHFPPGSVGATPSAAAITTEAEDIKSATMLQNINTGTGTGSSTASHTGAGMGDTNSAGHHARESKGGNQSGEAGGVLEHDHNHNHLPPPPTRAQLKTLLIHHLGADPSELEWVEDGQPLEPVTFDAFCRFALQWRDRDPESAAASWRLWVEGEFASSTMLDEEQHHALDHAQERQTASQIVRTLAAGGCAGCLAKTVVAPVDRVKILFQVTQGRHFTLGNAYRELLRIRADEGARALWRGNSAAIARVFPYAGIQFCCYDQMKRAIARRRGGNEFVLSPTESVFAGACAGAISVSLVYPLDVLRARFAVQIGTLGVTGAHTSGTAELFGGGLLHAARLMVRDGGVGTLYRGISPALLGILPYAGVAFAVNDGLKNHFSHGGTKRISVPTKLACGGFAGLVSQTLTYPIDVIRRRMQADGFMHGLEKPASAAASGSAAGQNYNGRRYNTILSTGRHILQTEGMRGLFKGVSINWIKGPITISLSFTAFDKLKQVFRVDQPHYEEQ